MKACCPATPDTACNGRIVHEPETEKSAAATEPASSASSNEMFTDVGMAMTSPVAGANESTLGPVVSLVYVTICELEPALPRASVTLLPGIVRITVWLSAQVAALNTKLTMAPATLVTLAVGNTEHVPEMTRSELATEAASTDSSKVILTAAGIEVNLAETGATIEGAGPTLSIVKLATREPLPVLPARSVTFAAFKVTAAIFPFVQTPPLNPNTTVAPVTLLSETVGSVPQVPLTVASVAVTLEASSASSKVKVRLAGIALTVPLAGATEIIEGPALSKV